MTQIIWSYSTENSLIRLMETFFQVGENFHNINLLLPLKKNDFFLVVHRELGTAIRAVPRLPKYVPDSESYRKSYYLTVLMDGTLACYQSEVAAVADLPRSAAELFFIRQLPPPAVALSSSHTRSDTHTACYIFLCLLSLTQCMCSRALSCCLSVVSACRSRTSTRLPRARRWQWRCTSSTTTSMLSSSLLQAIAGPKSMG